MQTSTTYHVGSAQRFTDRPAQYVVGRQEFKSMDQVRNYIAGLLAGYQDRGVDIEANEFVPVEIKTTIHTTLD
jgi:hypothetical protein